MKCDSFKPSELRRNVVFLKARVRFVPLTSDFSFLGTNLVKKAIYAMVEGDCDEVSRAGLFPREEEDPFFMKSAFTSRRQRARGSFNIPNVANTKSAF